MSKAHLVLGLAAAAIVSACAAETAPSPSVETESAEIVASADRTIENEIKGAIRGLSTDGSEGDPDDYELVSIKLRARETLTDAIILERIFPKLDGLEDFGDLTRDPGLVETPIAEAWQNMTPSAKWRKVKTVFDRRLTNVRYFDMGYRTSYSGTSIENGTVAHVFRIDIWT